MSVEVWGASFYRRPGPCETYRSYLIKAKASAFGVQRSDTHEAATILKVTKTVVGQRCSFGVAPAQ